MSTLWWSLPAILLLVLILYTPAIINRLKRRKRLNDRFRKFKGSVEGRGAAPTRPPIRRTVKLVIAPNYRWFMSWATIDMHMNPRDFIYLSEDRSVRGRHYILNWDAVSTRAERDNKHYLLLALLPCGFVEYINERGEKGYVGDLLP